MKKLSLCIGVFLVLFLMINVYTVKAQADLTAYNGQWLKDVLKYSNMVRGSSFRQPPEDFVRFAASTHTASFTFGSVLQ